jgi:hypothetical protein
MKHIALLLLLALGLSCREAPVTADPNDPSQVILAFVRERAGFKNPMLLESTAALPDDFSRYTQGSWLDSGVVRVKEALRDLVVHNRTRQRWNPEMIRTIGARPIGTSPPHEYFDGTGAQTTIEVSAPGFSSDSSIAVVYWEYYCGSLCAGADVAIFRRDSLGAWRGWRSQMLWIS